MTGVRASAPDSGISRLQVRHLQKTYGSRKVVKDVSLDVAKGEVVGLLGPNGAGKTTLLKTLAGLVNRESGTIRFPAWPAYSSVICTSIC